MKILLSTVLSSSLLAAPSFADEYQSVEFDDESTIEIEEVSTPDWIHKIVAEDKFEAVDPSLVNGRESIMIDLKQDDDDDDDKEKQKKPKVPIKEPEVEIPEIVVNVPDDPMKTTKPQTPETGPYPVQDDGIFGGGTPSYIPDTGLDGIIGGSQPYYPPTGGGIPGQGGVFDSLIVIDQVVNIGHRVWQIISQNKPVSDVRYKYANAIPNGLTSGMLENFSSIQARTYRVTEKRFGMKAYEIEYAVIHRFGGKYKGVGNFLERVSIVPVTVRNYIASTVNFDVHNVTVANLGKKGDPIASLGLDATIETSTNFKKTNKKLLFEFRGDKPSVRKVVTK